MNCFQIVVHRALAGLMELAPLLVSTCFYRPSGTSMTKKKPTEAAGNKESALLPLLGVTVTTERRRNPPSVIATTSGWGQGCCQPPAWKNHRAASPGQHRRMKPKEGSQVAGRCVQLERRSRYAYARWNEKGSTEAYAERQQERERMKMDRCDCNEMKNKMESEYLFSS